MKQWFAKRDYPQDLINTDMNKVKFPFVENKNNNEKEKGTPFVVTHYLNLWVVFLIKVIIFYK